MSVRDTESKRESVGEREKKLSGKESKLDICFNELFDYLLHVLIIIRIRLRASKIRLSNLNPLVVWLFGWLLDRRDEQGHRAQTALLVLLFRTGI